ncbi:DUF4388 domain-containing protein [Vulgatibacter sp.]|uniref:DUF4388 domain-containing protein n=1 Tax=Vulgatibacter sp. TaxID=1971226 RepID=UPI0035652325
MALKGTLKDFGVAEILQLIAQQTKTGVLRLQNKEEEVHVCFDQGNVIRAEQVAGKETHLLGFRLVRAGLITERELEDALEEQRRTLKRLGDVLVARGTVGRDELREMAQLQATETLYRLFTWKSGTYEFEAGEVAWERGTIHPIRGEAILMEGFRMVDEWPLIRKKIGSRRMTFERLKDWSQAEAEQPADDEGFDAAFEASFGGDAPAAPGAAVELGPNERRVFELVQTGRTVERLVELSRLGEFETCKALFNLVGAGYLRAIAPPRDEGDEQPGAGMVRALAEQGASFALRVAVSVAMLGLLTGIVHLVRADEAAGGPGGIRVEETAAQRLVGHAQLARISGALEVYRLEAGHYPEALDELLEAELLAERDLRYPWHERYHYRRTADDAFVLLPPFE